MDCPGCGTKRIENYTRCHVCGTSFEEAATTEKHIETQVQYETEKQIESMALISFISGLTSIFFYFLIVPQTIAVVFGIVSISNYDPQKHKGKWMAITGIVLGILYLLVAIRTW